MDKEIIDMAGEIIKKRSREGTYCTISLIDLEGYPTASTITVSKSDGIHWIAFCTGLGGTRTNRIAVCNRASICFNWEDYNITLVGKIDVVTDPRLKKEMWYGGLANHFSSCEDPGYCVLLFKTQRYNLLIDGKEVTGTL